MWVKEYEKDRIVFVTSEGEVERKVDSPLEYDIHIIENILFND